MSLLQIAAALLCGSAIGFPLALLGAGGSILAVPLLVYGFGRDVPAAAGTSLVVVGAIAAVGSLLNYRAGRVLPRTGLLFGSIGAVGALLGARLNSLVAGHVVLLLFALVMLAVAVGMLRASKQRLEVASTFREPLDRRSLARALGAGLTVGVLSGLLGVGAGFLIVQALVLAARTPIHYAVGTSLFVIALQSTGGLVSYVLLGKVDFALAALLLGGGVLGTWLGIRLAGRLTSGQLRHAFASFIVVVALFLVYQNGSALFVGR
jgi:uncharacterized membrane protein YfcA